MILFHAKRDGTVTTTPNFVPQGSSMQDLVVVSDFAYDCCAIKLLPASGEYIEDIPCTPILQKDYSTIFTAALPPKATVVAGSVDYQLIFTAADGTTQTTLAGSFTVPRGVPVSTPGSVEELAAKTINDIYTVMANTYGLFVGHEGNIYKNTEDIAALKKTIASAGYVTIPVTQWEDSSPTIADFILDGFGKGMSALLMPADSNTQTAAREARLSAFPNVFRFDDDTQTVEIIRANADKAPEIPLRFAYLILKTTDTTVLPSVAIIGVDAYGEGGGTASGVDETAVNKIINSLLGNVDNVRQYSADNPPPYPVTSVNGKTGAVNLNAADVGARSSTWMPTAADVRADSAGTAQALVDDLARKTAQDLANYYTRSQTFNKDEINALVSAIPKFKIEVVTSLPTSNISETTVYLVKSGADSSNLYIEYIYTNDAWERLGTQTVDLTGYATEAWVNALIAAYVKTADMEAYVADLLKAYLTRDELNGAINTALEEAKESGEFDGESVTVSEVTESSESGGENVVKFSGGKTLIVKNGKDGLKGDKGDPYTLTEDDKALIVAQVIQSLGGNPVFGYVDENNNIVVQGALADGTYTVKYEMEDGTTVDIGALVLDSTTYYSVTKNLTNCTISNSATQVVAGGSYSATVTANSGYTLDSVSVTMGGSAVSVSGGVINIASVTGDIVITATASETVVEPAYKNLCVENGDGWITDGRCGSDGTDRPGSAGNTVTNYIPVKIGDVVRVKNLEVARGGSLYSGIYKADADKTAIKGFYMTTDYADCVTNIDRVDGSYACSFTIAHAEAGYIRLCGQRKSNDTEIIITVNQEIE